jgi:uncharacterized protein (TIGR03435 family)
MSRFTPPLLAILLAGGAGSAQPAGSASFEVASVRLSPPPQSYAGISGGCNGGPGSGDPGLWTCRNVSMSILIGMSYDLQPYQISAQPGAREDRYDITARIPQGATRAQFHQMQQNFLRERFGLALHFEKKETQAYTLVVAKNGLRMKEAQAPQEVSGNPRPPTPTGPPASDKDGFPVIPPGRAGMAIVNHYARWVAPGYSMEQIANMLAGQLHRPVINATGLNGRYDLSLVWIADGMQSPNASPDSPADSASGQGLLSALQDQLGLTLQPTKSSINVAIIDRVERQPTEN